MIIFGWGFVTKKNFGPVQKLECEHCHNESFFQLERWITWFTLFFVPVIPYSFQYHFYCPVCRYGLRLDASKAKELIPIAKLNKFFLKRKSLKKNTGKRSSCSIQKSQRAWKKR